MIQNKENSVTNRIRHLIKNGDRENWTTSRKKTINSTTLKIFINQRLFDFVEDNDKLTRSMITLKITSDRNNLKALSILLKRINPVNNGINDE